MTETEKEAQQAGVCFYTVPSEVVQAQIDPLMWPIVHTINQSGWVFTGESCQGHPDAAEHDPWSDNVEPMLRLICRKEHFGRMLFHLIESSSFDEDGLPRTTGFKIYPARKNWGQFFKTKDDPAWREILVYIPASTVYSRNLGIVCYQRFADAVLADHSHMANIAGQKEEADPNRSG